MEGRREAMPLQHDKASKNESLNKGQSLLEFTMIWASWFKEKEMREPLILN